MSRLDEALETLRKAAGTRAYVVIVDACDPEAANYNLRIEWTRTVPTYVAVGLLEQAKHIVLDNEYSVAAGDDADDDAPPKSGP